MNNVNHPVLRRQNIKTLCKQILALFSSQPIFVAWQAKAWRVSKLFTAHKSMCRHQSASTQLLVYLPVRTLEIFIIDVFVLLSQKVER
jgi:hypothetical protein